jgi:hypothetical protein
MKTLAILLLAAMLGRISVAEELKAGMSLHSAQRILEESGAQKNINAYHFPWTSKFIEVKVLDSETWEQSEERTAAELKKVTGKSGYSVFYTLKDKTRLELVFAVDGSAKVIHAIRLWKPALEYKDKFEWIAAGREGKLRVLTSLDPKR